MAARSYDERIDELKKRREQLKVQEQALLKRKSADERKQRTHRLIGLGAAVEMVLGRATVDGDRERLIHFLNGQEARGHYFTNAMNEKAPADNGSKDDE